MKNASAMTMNLNEITIYSKTITVVNYIVGEHFGYGAILAQTLIKKY